MKTSLSCLLALIVSVLCLHAATPEADFSTANAAYAAGKYTDAKQGYETLIREGDYAVVCAELCGLGHAAMRQTAHVLPKAEFDSWLNEQRSKAAQ